MGNMRAGRVHAMSEAEEWLHRRMRQQREHALTMWAVERRQDAQLVGACGLFPQDARLELAYIIDHRHRGSGYASEAARAAVAAGRARRPGWRIYATIRPNNPASVRVAESAGLQPAAPVEDDAGALLIYDTYGELRGATP